MEVVGDVSTWKSWWGVLTCRLVIDGAEDGRGHCGYRIVVAKAAVTISAPFGAYL